jgi:hypothetical protein
MDALDILARIDAGLPASHEELGYLLSELEQRGRIKAKMVQRCCNKIFARIYHFRGRELLWVGGQLGYAQTGIVKVPPRAVILTATPPGFQLHGYISTTTCRKCGRGWHLFRDSLTEIAAIPGVPPTFGRVVD